MNDQKCMIYFIFITLHFDILISFNEYSKAILLLIFVPKYCKSIIQQHWRAGF